MALWPRDHSNGGTPISKANALSVAAELQQKADQADASGDSATAGFMREGVDQELGTVTDITRLEAHGFTQPKN